MSCPIQLLSLADRNRVRELVFRKPDSYQEAKILSQEIDSILGINENAMQGSSLYENWSHLSQQVWQTPYHEFKDIIDFIQPTEKSRWVDLGAGYGRLGIVLGIMGISQSFIGYEIESKRVETGNRALLGMQLKESKLITADISLPTFKPVSANYYFMYDYGNQESLLKTLEDLKSLSMKNKITVIGRGRNTRQWIGLKHPWLGYVVSPHHTEHWSIYKSHED